MTFLDANKKILFFSGGTAFNATSKVLSTHTKNAVHIVTTFDSGGSTGILRKLFPIPAVGDIRNRILAVADTATLHRYIVEFFSFRTSKEPTIQEKNIFYAILSGTDPRWNHLHQKEHKEALLYAQHFLTSLPASFTLNNASVGNCIIAGAILYHNNIYTAVERISAIVHAQSIVLPVVSEIVTLIAHNSCYFLCGQDRITKHAIQAPLQDIFLATQEKKPFPHIAKADVSIPNAVAEHIIDADYICYPMGSFYTSIVASLLPNGIAKYIAERDVPKIYIPNIGIDTEQGTMSIAQCVQVLLQVLGHNSTEPATKYITHVIIDDTISCYPNGIEKNKIRDMGIVVVEKQGITDTISHVPQKLIDTIYSI